MSESDVVSTCSNAVSYGVTCSKRRKRRMITDGIALGDISPSRFLIKNKQTNKQKSKQTNKKSKQTNKQNQIGATGSSSEVPIFISNNATSLGGFSSSS